MRISDWSSDVCSSDLVGDVRVRAVGTAFGVKRTAGGVDVQVTDRRGGVVLPQQRQRKRELRALRFDDVADTVRRRGRRAAGDRKSVAEGQSVFVRVTLGGWLILKKKNRENQCH